MFLNIVKIALRALWRNAMRSFLTILGIVIGVAAVIAMVSIGRGASAAVQERISTMGNNLLIVLSGSTTQAGVRSGAGGRPTLTVRDAQAIQRECAAELETSAPAGSEADQLLRALDDAITKS